MKIRLGVVALFAESNIFNINVSFNKENLYAQSDAISKDSLLSIRWLNEIFDLKLEIFIVLNDSYC